MKLYMYRWRREGGVVGHRELLRLFSFTHPFWACLGGLQLYMPRRPETWVLLWNIWWNADACRSARLSSGRIVLRVTQVAMRGNSCIHPIDLSWNSRYFHKMKSTSTNNYSSSPTSVFCIFHSPLYLYQFEHNNFFGNIDLEKSCAWNEFYI